MASAWIDFIGFVGASGRFKDNCGSSLSGGRPGCGADRSGGRSAFVYLRIMEVSMNNQLDS